MLYLNVNLKSVTYTRYNFQVGIFKIILTFSTKKYITKINYDVTLNMQKYIVHIVLPYTYLL